MGTGLLDPWTRGRHRTDRAMPKVGARSVAAFDEPPRGHDSWRPHPRISAGCCAATLPALPALAPRAVGRRGPAAGLARRMAGPHRHRYSRGPWHVRDLHLHLGQSRPPRARRRHRLSAAWPPHRGAGRRRPPAAARRDRPPWRLDRRPRPDAGLRRAIRLRMATGSPPAIWCIRAGTGRSTYHGRADEMMNPGGIRVSPREVETALADLPGVTDLAVAEVPAWEAPAGARDCLLLRRGSPAGKHSPGLCSRTAGALQAAPALGASECPAAWRHRQDRPPRPCRLVAERPHLMPAAIRLDIFSDPVCPWCYVGKANLDRALEAHPDHPFQVEWHPFQLNPDIPPEGVPKRDYLEAKFGGAGQGRRHRRPPARSGAHRRPAAEPSMCPSASRTRWMPIA